MELTRMNSDPDDDDSTSSTFEIDPPVRPTSKWEKYICLISRVTFHIFYVSCFMAILVVVLINLYANHKLAKDFGNTTKQDNFSKMSLNETGSFNFSTASLGYEGSDNNGTWYVNITKKIIENIVKKVWDKMTNVMATTMDHSGTTLGANVTKGASETE